MRGRGEVEGNDLCLNRVEVGKVGGGKEGGGVFSSKFCHGGNRNIFACLEGWWGRGRG